MKQNKNRMNIVGEKYGRLTVVSEAESKGYTRYWLCKCKCGNEITVSQNSLRNKLTKSCGCIKKDGIHKLSHHPLYHSWLMHKQRYKICKEWKADFLTFYHWAISHGYKQDLELGRIDKNKPFLPNNCKFMTHREISLNSKLIKSNNISGFRGVFWSKNTDMWMAQIKVKSNRIYLGSYKDIEEAVEARNDYIKEKNLEKDYQIQKI